MFLLSIVTPDKKLLTDVEAEEIFVPAFRGELNILPGHAPLVTTLSTGILRYRLKGETQVHAVAMSWGYLEVSHAGVSILAETAETSTDLDRERVHVALKESLSKLSAPDLDVELLEKYRRKYERAVARNELLDTDSNQTTH
jgi:F-type H+-transporting ATPase subunit epsilon